MKPLLAILATAVASVVVANATATRASPSQVIDRTFICTPVTLDGDARELDLIVAPRGSPGRRGGLLSDLSAGYIAVISGPQRLPGAELVQVSARPEPRWQNTTLPPGVYANVRRCRSAAVAVPLSPKGFAGPPVAFQRDADCDVTGRVRIRVRAVLEGPAQWRRVSPPSFGARRNVVAAKIAVRSERAGRPIALLAIDPAGETRLWLSSGCA